MRYEIMPSATISQIESRINEIFTMAEICKFHSSELDSVLNDRIIGPINYRTECGRRRHSVWLSGYVAGYIASKRNYIWNNLVEFCYSVDDELYSTNKDSTRKTTELFYKNGQGSILANSEGAHYWKNSDKKFSGVI